MLAKAPLLKLLRAVHLYIGAFTTPAILFFAFTGALQTFGLHETNRDHPNYKPARWVAVLGQLHKKQTAVLPVRRPPPSPVRAAAAPVAFAKPAPASVSARHPLPLRVFFALVCLGLFASTLTGLSLTYKYVRNHALVTGLVVAGVVVPLVLVFV